MALDFERPHALTPGFHIWDIHAWERSRRRTRDQGDVHCSDWRTPMDDMLYNSKALGHLMLCSFARYLFPLQTRIQNHTMELGATLYECSFMLALSY